MTTGSNNGFVKKDKAPSVPKVTNMGNIAQWIAQAMETIIPSKSIFPLKAILLVFISILVGGNC